MSVGDLGPVMKWGDSSAESRVHGGSNGSQSWGGGSLSAVLNFSLFFQTLVGSNKVVAPLLKVTTNHHLLDFTCLTSKEQPRLNNIFDTHCTQLYECSCLLQ